MLYRAPLVNVNKRRSLSLSWYIMLCIGSGPSSRGNDVSLLLAPLTRLSQRLSSTCSRAMLQACGGRMDSCGLSCGGQLAAIRCLQGWNGAVLRPLTRAVSARGLRNLMWG